VASSIFQLYKNSGNIQRNDSACASAPGSTRRIAAWRRDYNESRPHSSLGYLTPAEFAAQQRLGISSGTEAVESND